MNDHAGVNVS